MSAPQDSAKRVDELKRALVAVRSLRERVDELERREAEPIAVVGMACRFPGGASTPDKLWSLLRDGVDATCPVPPERWDLDEFYDPDTEAIGKIYVNRGGFLAEPVDLFDAGLFGISPREAEAMDPLQRLLLELAWEALERAGIPPLSLDGSDTGVFVGVSGSEFEGMVYGEASPDDIHAYRGTGTASSVTGGRISHVLGLQGPNISMDTACSSSLVATVLALEHLRAGRCSMALAGGAQLMFGPDPTMFLCRLRALSPGGRCRTFDAAADGYARGEGGALFVLKRLSDAQANGDRIHALIRGGACNHDGHSSGLTVPNPVAQRAVIEAAIASGGLRPEEIDYVEAHGTATPLGDPIEVRALSEAIARHRSPDRPLLLGSIKTNIGHAEAAAGSAGLMKTLLSLSRGAIPPHINLEEPTPHVDWSSIPVEIVTDLRPLDPSAGPFRAGVSAFGFSGTNAHVVLESAPPEPERAPRPSRGAELVLASGKMPGAVQDNAAAVAAHLREVGDAQLGDVAYTLAVGRSPLACRAAVVGTTATDIADQLDDVARGAEGAIEHCRPGEGGRLAMLFTGQGAQYPGMARELIEGSAVYRAEIERCHEILSGHLDRGLLSLLLEEDDPDVLKQTAYAQPTLFSVEYALAALWKSWGIEPAYVLGHSLGEYVAATVAGVMDLADALPLVALRGRLMQDLPPGGAMVAIEAAEDSVAERAAKVEGVGVAASNGPLSTVVSGEVDAVREVTESFEAEGVRCRELEVSHAFHSHRMDPMLDAFEQAVADIDLRAPEIGLVSNVTGAIMTPDEARDPARWRRHIREPVRFLASMETLEGLEVETFLECGPHPTLSAMGAACLPGTSHRWLPSMRRGQGQWARLLESLGGLYQAGYEIDWRAYGADQGGKLTEVPTYQFQRERHWPRIGSARSSGAAIGAKVVHPLLGAPLRSPAIDGWVFQQTMDAHTPAYLSDHRFGGEVVVPGAAYVEMALAAARYGPGWDGVGLEDVTFEQAITIEETEAVIVQTIVSAPKDGSARLRVVARPFSEESAEDTPWQTVATARLTSSAPHLDGTVTSEWRAPERSLDMEGIYDQLLERGLEYRESFRVVADARADARCSDGRVELAARDARDVDAYCVHPAILDSGLHLIGAILDGTPKYKGSYLPFSFDGVRFLGPVGTTCTVRVVLREDPNDDPNPPKSDLAFFDEAGELLGVVKGYEARRVVARRATGPDAYAYDVAWRPAAAPEEVDPPTGRWLVLDGGGPVSSRIADAIASAGAECVSIPLDESGDLDELSGTFDGVVHAWGLTEASVETGSDLVEAIAGSVMPVSRLLADEHLDEGGRLVVLTKGAQAAGRGSGDSWAVGGALWGAYAALRAERAELSMRVVDLDPHADAVPEALDAWVFGAGEEDRIALRDGTASAARLVRRNRTRASERTPGIVFAENYRLEIERRGTLEAIHFVPTERTEPGPGMVEVRVTVTGLNFRDVLNVLGQYPGDPGPPGLEFSGVVERVGEGVTTLAPGDEVIGMYASMFTGYATLPATSVVPKPATLTHDEAATIPVTFLTADWGLRHLARLSEGERVLIHAGAGGVGQAAIQIARDLGAEVFTTASESKRPFLREQGIEHVFDSRSTSFYEGVLEATGGEGVDVVLNALTGELLQKSMDLLREGGRFVELGKMELFDPDELAAERGIEYAAFELGTIPLSTEDFRDFFAAVAARFDEGALQPLRVRSFPAGEVVDAFRFMAQARHVGKVTVHSALLRPHRPIRPDGTYVVTGATGGIGPQLVQWLADQGAGTIVVSSRSEPSGEAAEAFDRLREAGADIVFAAADTGEADAVSALLDRARENADHPLRGVFHAAGVLDDRMLQDVDAESLRKVLRPKVVGAVALDRMTREDELDQFVLFSSAAAVVGGVGQSSYSAANAFMDTLVHHRRRLGLPGLSIEWGAWGGSGMAHRLDERQKRALERAGTRFLDPDVAFAKLDMLLQSDDVSTMVADIDWSVLGAAGTAVPPFAREVGSAAGGDGDGSQLPKLDREELQKMDAEARATRVEEFVIATIAAVLGLPPDQLDPDTVIGVLGFDSLMAVELRNRIDAELGITLPTGELLGEGTVRDVADLLTLRLDVGELDEADEGSDLLETFEV